MRRILLGLALVAAWGVPAQEARAQNEFNLLHAPDGFVYLTFDFDPAPALSLGYARSVAVDALARDVTVSLEITKPLFLRGLRNIQVEVGSRIPLVMSGDWKVVNRFSLIYHAEDNYLFSGRGLSVEEALLPGYFSSRLYAAGEIGYTWFWRTRIRPHAAPEDARWFTGAGGKITLGLLGGYTFDERFDVSVRSGFVKTETFGRFNPAGPPILANLGLGYRY